MSRIDRALDYAALIVVAIAGAVLAAIVAMLLVFLITTAWEEDTTCPNYGERPVLIDGGYECLPWEVTP